MHVHLVYVGGDLAAAGMGALTGVLANSNNKKAKKLGKGLKFLGRLKEAKETIEETME